MIFEPETYEEVREVFERGEPLVIHSSMPLEEPTRHVLSLTKLNQILLYEPEEMIVKVQAGMTLRALNDILQAKGQWIPTLVAGENPESTVGAAIANDLYHPRAAVCGALRTAILGGTFAAADGTLFKSGSRVVKSVAGYDTHRAFCGSRGMFGAILDVTLKVQPMPEAFFRCDVATKEYVEKYSPAICELESTVFCELAGYAEDIENDRRELAERSAVLRSYTEHEALLKISSIIERHRLSMQADDQLENLRMVFDPKGILR